MDELFPDSDEKDNEIFEQLKTLYVPYRFRGAITDPTQVWDSIGANNGSYIDLVLRYYKIEIPIGTGIEYIRTGTFRDLILFIKEYARGKDRNF